MQRAYVDIPPEDATIVPPADVEAAKAALPLFPGQWDALQATPVIAGGLYSGMGFSVCHDGRWVTIISTEPAKLLESDQVWLNHLVTGFNLAFFRPKQEAKP